MSSRKSDPTITDTMNDIDETEALNISETVEGMDDEVTVT